MGRAHAWRGTHLIFVSGFLSRQYGAGDRLWMVDGARLPKEHPGGRAFSYLSYVHLFQRHVFAAIDGSAVCDSGGGTAELFSSGAARRQGAWCRNERREASFCRNAGGRLTATVVIVLYRIKPAQSPGVFKAVHPTGSTIMGCTPFTYVILRQITQESQQNDAQVS